MSQTKTRTWGDLPLGTIVEIREIHIPGGERFVRYRVGARADGGARTLLWPTEPGGQVERRGTADVVLAQIVV